MFLQNVSGGFMISFSGIITFNNADRLREVVKNIPDDYLLIETDSPYLAPKPFRGKQNWPGHVSRVAEKIAELTGAKIKITASNDPRSYRQDSTKLLNTGFTPQFGVNDAIDELVAKYQSGDLIEKDSYYTVKTMKSLIKTGDL